MGGGKRTDGYAGRLKQALATRDTSVRSFADELSERYPDLRGASYGGVRQYVEGKVRNPRIELLRAIADILIVRWEWLAYNSGEMTEDHEALRLRRESVAELPTDVDPNIVACILMDRLLNRIRDTSAV